MKCPRKIYMVVSRRAVNRASLALDLFNNPRAARVARDLRNRDGVCGVTDWRVETFVKGD